MSENMCKDVSSASRIKFNIRRKQKSYIYWRFLKDHDKKLVSTSLDPYLDQTE